MVAPLLRPDLDDAAGLLGDPADLLALVDGQGHRLLAVDVLARPHGVDADLRVPVVGCADDHGVDILAVEDLTIILVDVRLILADATVGIDRPGVALVHVADGEEIAELVDAPWASHEPWRPQPIRPSRARSFLARASSAIDRPKGMRNGSSAGLVAATRRNSRRFCVRNVIVADLREEYGWADPPRTDALRGLGLDSSGRVYPPKRAKETTSPPGDFPR